LKTSEIAEYIATRNVRVWIGGKVPFLPLSPLVGSRTFAEIGWAAFQLARMADPEVAGPDAELFFFNRRLGAFAVLLASVAEDLGGWELVEFDGYGELESWKEVAG
jgi:hypothetical protein